MKYNQLLKEAVETDQAVQEFIKNPQCHPSVHPFMKSWLKNYEKRLMEANIEMGKLRGQTVGDTVGPPPAGEGMQVAATLEIFNAVIRGFSRYMDDTFVKKYTTDSVVFKIPKVEYQELVDDISAGQLPHTEKKIDYATVDLSNPESEKGGKVTWTRALLEDVTFDVQEEMMEGLGHAVAQKILSDILAKVQSCPPEKMPSGGIITLSNPVTWKEFLSVIGAVDVGKKQSDNTFKHYGPADYALVSPDIYWQLLDIIQLTNVLYEGSTDPINKGLIKLALGCTISKQSLLPAGTIIALNSAKAVALVTRRTLKIEPVVFPSFNEYGFIGTVRYGVTNLFEGAIQIGKVSGS